MGLPVYVVPYLQNEQRGGVERMTADDRRAEMMSFLFEHRHTTYDHLAQEFHVSRRTVQNDIQILMCSYPILTLRGRYGGGVKLEDWYSKQNHSHLSYEQIKLLVHLRSLVDGRDLMLLDSIIKAVSTV